MASDTGAPGCPSGWQNGSRTGLPRGRRPSLQGPEVRMLGSSGSYRGQSLLAAPPDLRPPSNTGAERKAHQTPRTVPARRSQDRKEKRTTKKKEKMQDTKVPSLQSHFAPKTEPRALNKEQGALERAIPQKCKTRVPTLTRQRGSWPAQASCGPHGPRWTPKGKRPPGALSPQPAIRQVRVRRFRACELSPCLLPPDNHPKM